ncbi:hypothetical protein COO60DRAFT_774830 [Scenedesmus sp. NREL 46B-D3]|nr:hypothetical protein COO60DRAFT_774830 [Scenedesmus sp. NREL 46B-D3]
MQRLTVAYYASGAFLGFLLGCVSVWVQILQLVPGLGLLANALRVLLPQPSRATALGSTPQSDSSSSSHPSQPHLAAGDHSAPSSFAAMAAGALGSAPYQTQGLGRNGDSSSFPGIPHQSFQNQQPPSTAAAAAAHTAVSAFRGTTAFTLSAEFDYSCTVMMGSPTPWAAQEAAAAGGAFDRQQVLAGQRERLLSYPIYISLDASATVLPHVNALASGGNPEHGGDEGVLSYYATGLVSGMHSGKASLWLLRSSTARPHQGCYATAVLGGDCDRTDSGRSGVAAC